AFRYLATKFVHTLVEAVLCLEIVGTCAHHNRPIFSVRPARPLCNQGEFFGCGFLRVLKRVSFLCDCNNSILRSDLGYIGVIYRGNIKRTFWCVLWAYGVRCGYHVALAVYLHAKLLRYIDNVTAKNV